MNKRFRNPNKIDLPHDIDQESLLSLYDRESRDLELFNSIDAEIIKLSGSKLFYYKVFINENYDRVYLEERNKVVSKDPIVVWASYDPKPIEENVSEFGLELTNDQVFVFNKSYIERVIGRAPQPGDVVESPVQNIKYEIYEVQEDSFEVYGVFHYNCYGRILRDSSDVVDEPALETFEEIGADLLFTRSDYEDLSVAAMTNADITAPESPPVIVPDPDENILALFANGEVGAWYDPSDLTTVFQDAAGTTPANVGDPVGLILDKSQGLELGPELVTNGTFDTDTTGWSALSDSILSAVNGKLVITIVASDTFGKASALENVEPNKFYKINFEVVSFDTDSVVIQVGKSGAPGYYYTQTVFSSGTYSIIVRSENELITIELSGSNASPKEFDTTVVIDNVSLKELPGNHATQTTSAARPVLQQSGGLYYLDFDGVDDWMGDVVFSSPIPVPMTYSIAAQWSGNGSSASNEYLLDSTNTNRHAIYKNTSDIINVFVTTNVSLSPATTLGADELLTIDVQGPSISSIRRNGSVALSGLSLNASLSQFRLANYFGGSGIGAFYLEGRIYGMVLTSRTLTAAEITDLETYLAAKSGVTLATAPIE